MKRRVLRGLGLLAAGVLLAGGALHIAVRSMPIPPALLSAPPESLLLTDRHGAPLREVMTGDQFARPAQFADLPPRVVDALLAAEDKRFFRHGGVDWLAASRAAFENLRQGRITSGASTFTQQLVKTAAPRARTLRTKAIEALTALRLEQEWSKERILVEYCNRIDFGNLNTGVAAAAHYYFGKPLADLTVAEAAFIAGLPKNPVRLNPHRRLERARARQATVLTRMERNGALERAARDRALAEPLRLQPRERRFLAPHFVDLLLRELPSRGGVVASSVDLGLQRIVERIVRERLAPLRAQNVRNAAAVILDNRTREILALAGSEDYFAPSSGQVNGAWSPRSAGSTLKPFTYLLALERGTTPSAVLADLPAQFLTSTGIYAPENYNQRCHGPVRLRLALGNSLNIPAVKLLSSLGGPKPLYDRLSAWGFTTLPKPAEEYGLGLTIGNAETRLVELVNAYAALARLGRFQPYTLLRGATMPGREQVFAEGADNAAAVWLVADMLQDNEARALSFGRESALRFRFPVACKTGTSTDFRDNWAVGFTPEFTVGVWVGNFDGAPMQEVSGVTGAAPILHDLFEHLHARHGTSWYPRPEGIVERIVHPLTGKLLRAGLEQGRGVRELFLAGHLPEEETPADYDESGRVILGPEYSDWLRSADASVAARISPSVDATGLRLVSPIPGATFVIDPDVPTSAQIPLLAHASGAVEWSSSSLRCEQQGARTVAHAAEGRHTLTARDPASGRTVSTWVVVKSL